MLHFIYFKALSCTVYCLLLRNYYLSPFYRLRNNSKRITQNSIGTCWDGIKSKVHQLCFSHAARVVLFLVHGFCKADPRTRPWWMRLREKKSGKRKSPSLHRIWIGSHSQSYIKRVWKSLPVKIWTIKISDLERKERGLCQNLCMALLRLLPESQRNAVSKTNIQ